MSIEHEELKLDTWWKRLSLYILSHILGYDLEYDAKEYFPTRV